MELTKLVSLILIIPTTNACAERSFSTLKRIKTYLRNSLSQKRLSALSYLSIEKKFDHYSKTKFFLCDILEDWLNWWNEEIDKLFK